MIDAHQHFWKFDPVRDAWITSDMQALRRDFYPQDLEPLLKTSGITGTVAVQADQSLHETKFLLQQAQTNPFIKGVVGWIDLRSSELDQELSRLSQFNLLKGFRHIVQGEADPEFMLRPDFVNGMEKILSKGYTYDILIRDHQLSMAVEFCNRFPGANLVIDHLAKPPIRSGEWKAWAADLKKFSRLDYVYCKVSGLVTEAIWRSWKKEDFTIYLDVVSNVFGARRMMYGSDWPVCLLSATYPQQLEVVHHYFSTWSEVERQAIFHNNAVHFYHLLG